MLFFKEKKNQPCLKTRKRPRMISKKSQKRQTNFDQTI